MASLFKRTPAPGTQNGGDAVKTPKTTLEGFLNSILKATVKADTLASQEYANYLMETAFENPAEINGETPLLKTISFLYAEGASGRYRRVTVPLMSLLPLPMLCIKEAEFDFDVNVVAASDNERLGIALAQTKAPQADGASPTSMHVKLKLQQSDIPGGLSRLLNVVDHAIYSSSVSIESKEAAHE
jgi:hypothetical protein